MGIFYETERDLQADLLLIQNRVAAVSIGLHGAVESGVDVQVDELYGFSEILS